MNAILEKVTSFASLMLNAGRIRQIQDDTGRQYIGKRVIETTPRGNKWEATITDIEWCQTCGLNGEWLIYILYIESVNGLPGAWVSRDVLTLAEDN